MSDFFKQPPSVRGLKEAFVFFDIVQNIDERERIAKQFQEYTDEANRYFDAIGGIEQAKLDAAQALSASKLEAADIETSAQKKLDEARELTDKLQKQQEDLQNKISAQSETNRKLEVLRGHVASQLKDADQKVADLVKKEEQLEKKRIELVAKEARLDKEIKKFEEAKKLLA